VDITTPREAKMIDKIHAALHLIIVISFEISSSGTTTEGECRLELDSRIPHRVY